MRPTLFASTQFHRRAFAFEEGPYGGVETHWRRFEVKARLLERMWQGFEASQKIRNMIENSPNSEVRVSEGVIFDPKTKRYYGCLWVAEENRFSWTEDFGESSPWVTGRYTKVAGEVRGRGPAMQSLPDVRSLNKAKEFVLQKAAIDLAGMYTATDDGVTNPYNMVIAPGVVIPVGSNNTNNPSIQRLDTGSNLALAQFEIVSYKTLSSWHCSTICVILLVLFVAPLKLLLNPESLQNGSGRHLGDFRPRYSYQYSSVSSQY